MKQAKSDYEEYLEKYCEKRRISRAEAEQHYLVREVKKIYEEREKDADKKHNI